MKYILTIIKCILGILIIAAVSGCGQSGSVAGNAPTITQTDSILAIQVDSSQWENVTFTHKTHAENYLDNNCLVCHSHTGILDTTIWDCHQCHSPNDSEGLCADDADGHNCLMKQCEQCHLTLSPDPTPDCADCHASANFGRFLDGAVEGLIYETATKKGVTDDSGAFGYRPGEDVTFALGHIILGTGTAKSFMTPLDIVSGAVDEFDQTVTNISRFLQTIDVDGDHSNGITIPAEILNVIQNRSIDFTVDSATFETSPDLLAVLSDLNALGVFTGPPMPRTLVSEAQAQANLRSTLDIIMGAGCQITSIQSSPLAITGAYEPDLGYTFTYQWYRAVDAAGTGETMISGATGATYAPVSEDNNKYLTLEITANGTTSRCRPVIPDSVSGSVTVNGVISSDTEVDQIALQLPSPAGVTIDVLSYERNEWTYSHHYSPCLACHSYPDRHHSDLVGPLNLGFTDNGINNGDSNDKLRSTVFLFDTFDGSVVDTQAGEDAFSGPPGTYGAPGTFGTPGALTDFGGTRSTFNPYMDLSGYCTDPAFTNQVTCTTAYCQDYDITDQAMCTTGFCIDWTYGNEGACTGASLTWHSTTSTNTFGYCVNSAYTNATDCGNAGLSWTTPSTWNTASTWNPSSLPTGSYNFVIGAGTLSETDARSGVNGGGDNSGWSSYYSNNYKVTFTFNP